MNGSIKRHGFLCSMVLAAALLAGSSQAQSTIEKARTDGINAVVNNDPPYGQLQPNGTMTGPIPEIISGAMAQVGIKTIRNVSADWAAMVPGIQSNRFDITGVGLYMNARRCDALAFSQPIFCDKLAFVVKAGNPLKLGSIADLAANKAARIAGERGTAAERTMVEAGVKPEQLVAGSDAMTSLRLLQTGRADVVAIGLTQVKGFLSKFGDPTLVVVPIGDSQLQCAGVAFRKDDVALRDLFDTALGSLKSSGDYAKTMEKYDLDPQLALGAKREQFCKAGG
jgi:polar amino acid transport system substrate-binding protein